MTRPLLRGWLASVVVLFCEIVSAASAQNAATLAQFERGPHLGTIDDALVAIEVVNVSSDGIAQPPRRANGLILRCDGFVLTPSNIFDTTRTGASQFGDSQKVTVILHPGAENEKRFPARRPNWIATGWGDAVFKVDQVHAPAVRTLVPGALKPGDSVKIVWRPWNAASSRYGELERREKQIEGRAAADTQTREQELAVNMPVEGVVNGAVALGPEGMAVGMYVAADSHFLSFASLGQATNCVTPSSAAPTDADASSTPVEKRASGGQGMVDIPGGPVVLPAAVQSMQPDMFAARIACVAPFSIDQFEITNGDYFAFWQALPERERRRTGYFPLGWAEKDPPFPPALEKVPVIGVPFAGAEAYARFHGKRLPTPYEWALAAYGPKGENAIPDWAKRYVAERYSVWRNILNDHTEFVRKDPLVDIWQFTLYPLPPGAYRRYVKPGVYEQSGQVAPYIPFIYEWDGTPAYLPKQMEASVWSRARTIALVEPLFQAWKDPSYVLPVGSREFDSSPYGVMDMIMNATELIEAPPWPPFGGSQWQMEVQWPRSYNWKREDPSWRPYTFPFKDMFRPSNLEPAEPTLSRLLQLGAKVPMESLLAHSSFFEIVGMIHPVTGWALRIVPGLTAQGATAFWTNVDESRWWLPYAGARAWAHMPVHFHQETGRSFDDLQFLPRGNGLATYVLPAGFRCVK